MIVVMFSFRNQWNVTQDWQIQIGVQMNLTQISNGPEDKHRKNRDG